MTQNGTQTNGQETVLNPLLNFWSEWIERSQEQTKVLLDSMQGADDLTGLRHLWLESVGKSLEAYMRTPAFLEAMRRHFDVMTHLKGTTEDAARDLPVPPAYRVSTISAVCSNDSKAGNSPSWTG
jgi:hypothetical protein